jgi:hypothetical protein
MEPEIAFRADQSVGATNLELWLGLASALTRSRLPFVVDLTC